jgi:hypothetical protein
VTDITDRLRDDWACGAQSKLCSDAADEIDRLRAALRDALDTLDRYEAESHVADRARAALGE